MNEPRPQSLFPVPSTASPHDYGGTRTGTTVAREIRRRNANAQRVLDRLRIGPATNVELVAVGGMRACGARIPELRDEGWQIDAECVSRGLWRYTLKGMK